MSFMGLISLKTCRTSTIKGRNILAGTLYDWRNPRDKIDDLFAAKHSKRIFNFCDLILLFLFEVDFPNFQNGSCEHSHPCTDL